MKRRYPIRNVQVLRFDDNVKSGLDDKVIECIVGESYRDGEWVKIRSSLVVNIDLVKGEYETENSIYYVVEN